MYSLVSLSNNLSHISFLAFSTLDTLVGWLLKNMSSLWWLILLPLLPLKRALFLQEMYSLFSQLSGHIVILLTSRPSSYQALLALKTSKYHIDLDVIFLLINISMKNRTTQCFLISHWDSEKYLIFSRSLIKFLWEYQLIYFSQVGDVQAEDTE